MDTLPIPPHLEESVFRTYEDTIRKIMDAPANAMVLLDPSPLRPTTYSARLRDAITSHRTFKWVSNIDHEAFMLRRIQVSYNRSTGKVMAGNLKAPIGRSAAAELMLSSGPIPGYHDVVHAILVLLHHRILYGPINIRTDYNFTDCPYDVNVVPPDANGVVTLL